MWQTCSHVDHIAQVIEDFKLKFSCWFNIFNIKNYSGTPTFCKFTPFLGAGKAICLSLCPLDFVVMTPMSHHLDCQQRQYLLLFLLEQSHPEKMEKCAKRLEVRHYEAGWWFHKRLERPQISLFVLRRWHGMWTGIIIFFMVWLGSRTCWEESITPPQNHRVDFFQNVLWLDQAFCREIPKCP